LSQSGGLGAAIQYYKEGDMEIRQFTAPSYKELRPLKPEKTKTFPVYDDLVGKLVAAKHPDDEVRHVMATCAGYAYSDGQTVAMIMARLGLEENNCRMIDEYVDVMFITSTSFLIQSKDGRVVILCYRGTPPTSLITWLTDIDVNPAKIKIPFPDEPGEYYVHGGFYRNVRSTRYEIVGALERAMDGRSVLDDGAKLPHALEALYITGHSLGAASASMLAVMLLTEPVYEPIVSKLKAVYTFGQPMITSPELAEKCNANDFLHENVFRYVYANDIAPQLPPTESGAFKHFGTEYQYKPKGDGGSWHYNKEPRKQLKSLLELVGNPLSFVARQVKLTRNLTFHASVSDHLPQYYIAALTPPGVRSEFGD
jgi:hypothetical protein